MAEGEPAGKLVLQALGILPSKLNWKHSLDLTLHAGQIVVVQGPNGAGKTTLLNALTGANVPKHGT
ncbi:MAG: ATP-binding cassette domain-containing protein, partial [Armatimonadaceae bacterium]